MRDDNDDSFGGDLILYQTNENFFFTSSSESSNWIEAKYIKEVKTIKYKSTS